MKKLTVILICIFFAFNAFSQDKKTKGYYCDLKFEQEDSSYFLSNIVAIDSVTAIELFKKAKIWISENFNSAKNVIQSEDKELGFIICKGNINLESLERILNFKMKIEVKDKKYRVKVFDMTIKVNFDAKNTVDSAFSVLNKGEERSIEYLFPNWKNKQQIKNFDSLSKCMIMEKLDSLFSSLKKSMDKKDGW